MTKGLAYRRMALTNSAGGTPSASGATITVAGLLRPNSTSPSIVDATVETRMPQAVISVTNVPSDACGSTTSSCVGPEAGPSPPLTSAQPKRPEM